LRLVTANLNGHAAGNGGYSQGDTCGPLAASPTRRIAIAIAIESNEPHPNIDGHHEISNADNDCDPDADTDPEDLPLTARWNGKAFQGRTAKGRGFMCQ